MNFNNARRRAFVDEEEVMMDEETTANDIITRRGYDPSNRSLVVLNENEKPTVLRGDERISPRNGTFQTTVTPTGGTY